MGYRREAPHTEPAKPPHPSNARNFMISVVRFMPSSSAAAVLFPPGLRESLLQHGKLEASDGGIEIHPLAQWRGGVRKSMGTTFGITGSPMPRSRG
jgi:hypothetical protein